MLNSRIGQYLGKNRFLVRFVLTLFLGILLSIIPLSGAHAKTPTVRIPIFGFHDIVNESNPSEKPPQRIKLDNDYRKQDLYTVLNYWVKNNYWFLTPQDLFVYFIDKSKPIPSQYKGQKPIMVTFDDGYYGVHQNVLPILKDLEKKYQEKAKIVWFVNPALMGVKIKDFLPHASCEDLLDGYKRGFYDIQSHGHSHKKLTAINSKVLNFELEQAKLDLRECTEAFDKNKWVAAHIAYPYGQSNRQVEKLLPKYYLTGYVYDGNLLRINRYQNKYRLSRIAVNRYTSAHSLIKIAKRATTIK